MLLIGCVYSEQVYSNSLQMILTPRADRQRDNCQDDYEDNLQPTTEMFDLSKSLPVFVSIRNMVLNGYLSAIP